MAAPQTLAGPPKYSPIRFQPVLPQPAHPGRSLLAWGFPAFFIEGTLLLTVIWVSARSVRDEPVAEESYYYVELTPEVSVPKPPPPPEPPKLLGERATAAIPDAPVGFQTLTMPTLVLGEIPAPDLSRVAIRAVDFTGQGVEGARGPVADAEPEVAPLNAAPTFTPYTVAPRLTNAREIAEALVREYPPALRSAGIGGRVLLWLFIDEAGAVQNTVLKTSSGFEALDEAATRVAVLMDFTPALNRDRQVPVWVAIPIDFEVT